MATRTSLYTVLVVAWLLANGPVSAANYPQNPLSLGNAVYVSHQGVFRFDVNAPQPLWSSLQDVETFAPVAFGDLLLVGSTQGLYALRQHDGSVVWHVERAHTLFTPAVTERAYAGSVHGELYALNPQNGVVVWKKSFDGWIYSPVIGRQGKVLWTGGQPHTLFALSADGHMLQQLPTRQESVFGGVDIGQQQAAFNLFDGTTVIVDFVTLEVSAVLEGNSQPTGVLSQGRIIYRSHSDGSLIAFARGSLARRGQHPVAGQNLQLHPSSPGYLLLGDSDRQLFLFESAKHTTPCQLDVDAPWLLPAMVDPGQIIFFRKSMQPPKLQLVKTPALCH